MRFLLTLAVWFGCIGMPLMAAEPINDSPLIGFNGTLTGSVLKVGKDGAWFTIKIISAEGPEAPPADITASITCKSSEKAQTEWANSLKPNNQVVIKVKAGDQRKLILEEPGKKN